MAQVVFFRPGRLVGILIGFDVRETNAHIGELSNDGYFVCNVVPGRHVFTASAVNTDSLTLEIDEGEIAYVVGSASMGLFGYEANLNLSDESAFSQTFKRLHPANSHCAP